MTTYGTIPASSSAPSATSSPLDYIHSAKARGVLALASRRPWRELFNSQSFSLPPSLGEAYLRLRSNSQYFSMNYTIIILLIVFLSLLWHPVSLIVFVVTMIAWLFFYFLNDEPLVVLGREIGDPVVLMSLSIGTLVLLLLTNATANILVSLGIGFLVVMGHAIMRRHEENSSDDGNAQWYSPISMS